MGFFDKIFATKDAAATTATQPGDNGFISALSTHVRGDLGQALSAYKLIGEEHPDAHLALFFTAAIKASTGNIAEAAENLRFLSQQSAAKEETISRAIYLHLAALTSEEPHLDNPAVAEIIVTFADILKQEGFVQESAVCFEIAIGLAPDNAHLLHKFGDTLHDLHMYEYAEAVLLKALECAPNHWGALYTYAVLLQDLGRFDDAITYYEKAIRMNPDHVKCQNNYGAALMVSNRLDDALVHCTLAAELDPGFPLAKVNLGNIHMLMQQYGPARTCFTEAISLNEELAPAYFGLGAVELALGSVTDRVKELFFKAIELAPSIANFHHALGNLLADEANPEALSHFSTAVQLNTNLDGLHRDFGSACLKLGRRDDAREHLNIALQQNPGDESARELLARIEGESGSIF